jgi:hypothetical protein
VVVSESKPYARLKLWGVLGAALIFVAGIVANDLYDWSKGKLLPAQPRKPVTISLQLDPARWETGNIFGGESYEWVFPVSPSLLGRPPKGACYRRYKWSHGLAGSASAGSLGTDARTTRFRLTIQSGNGGQSVLLEKIVPIIHRHFPNDHGTHVACPVGGATANLRRFAIDLDRRTGVFTDGENNPLPTTMLKFGPQDSEPIMVIATAERAHYDWNLRLDFIIDGKPTSTYINDGRELFSTTGVSRAQMVHWAGTRWLPGEGPPVGNDSP